jgi:hypothetical protein
MFIGTRAAIGELLLPNIDPSQGHAHADKEACYQNQSERNRSRLHNIMRLSQVVADTVDQSHTNRPVLAQPLDGDFDAGPRLTDVTLA